MLIQTQYRPQRVPAQVRAGARPRRLAPPGPGFVLPFAGSMRNDVAGRRHAAILTDLVRHGPRLLVVSLNRQTRAFALAPNGPVAVVVRIIEPCCPGFNLGSQRGVSGLMAKLLGSTRTMPCPSSARVAPVRLVRSRSTGALVFDCLVSVKTKVSVWPTWMVVIPPATLAFSENGRPRRSHRGSGRGGHRRTGESGCAENADRAGHLAGNMHENPPLCDPPLCAARERSVMSHADLPGPHH